MKTFYNFPIIEKKRIELKAGIPQKFSIPGGVNVFVSLFEFQHNPIYNDKTIMAEFTDHVETARFLTPVYLSDMFSPIKELGREFLTRFNSFHTYFHVKFSSEEDIIFEFSIYRDIKRIIEELARETQEKEKRYMYADKKLSEAQGFFPKRDWDNFVSAKREWQEVSNSYWGLLSYLKKD